MALQLGCGSANEPATRAGAHSPQDPGARIWSYDVIAGPGASELRVVAELPRGVPAALGVDQFASPYLDDLEIATGEGWRPLQRQGERWYAPQCRERGCKLRYRYQLGQAAEQIDRFSYAAYRGGALLAPPSTWLLHPQDYSGADTYRFAVKTEPGEAFVTGVWSARSHSGQGGSEFSAPAALLFEAPYSGFGRFRSERLAAGAGVIHLSVSLGARGLGVSDEDLRATVLRASSVVSGYFGRFPVPELSLIVLPIAGSQIFGMQLGNGGASVLLFIGRDLRATELAADWVIVHELLHLGFPTLQRRHLWLAEGLATYQGPIARARAGLIAPAEVWRAFVAGMPNGQAEGADGGLDGTSSWGRTYWGGAAFFLLLDLQIRQRSAGRLSLDDVARAILNAGGNTGARWSVERTLSAGDSTLYEPSFSELYGEHAHGSVRVDLAALWQKLGVQRAGDDVTLDDSAEWAELRRAVTGPAAHAAQSGLSLPGVPKSPL